MAVELAPITRADLPAVSRFMHSNLNKRVKPSAWTRALEVPWAVSAPNHGYFLRDGGEVVGAYLAYYSDRTIDGRTEPFCNLGAWCVLEAHRAQGIRLLMALLRQRDYHFTDFSPSGNVVGLNRKLKFIDLDTTTAVMPNLPWFASRRKVRITSDQAVLAASLTGTDLQIYRDHRDTAAAHHVLLTSGSESCYVIFRKDSRKRVRAFASILYVGNRSLFRSAVRELGSYLLFRHAAAATLMEKRVVGGRPPGSTVLSHSRPKMFKSDRMAADQIDYLYSELTCLAW